MITSFLAELLGKESSKTFIHDFNEYYIYMTFFIFLKDVHGNLRALPPRAPRTIGDYYLIRPYFVGEWAWSGHFIQFD